MMTRAERLLAPLKRDARIIEIGPSFSPIAPKSAGWRSFVVDHASRDGLVAKYANDPNVDVSGIEEVDFVWHGGSLSDAVPANLHGSFDAFVASHVIEHTPDMLAFLSAAQTLLKPDGLVVLAVPDKRYCFDYFQPVTTTGQILEASSERRDRHTPRLAFDHFGYAALNGQIGAWGQAPSEGITLVHSLEEAQIAFESYRVSKDYIDLHAWRFTPASFELLFVELARLGKTDWKIDRITGAEGCEFFAWLRRGGAAWAASITIVDLNARRLGLLKRTMIETRAQIDWLLAGEPEIATTPVALLPPVVSQPVSSPAIIASATTGDSAPRYVDWFPQPANAGRAFDGEWSSAVPGLPSGQASLFNDARITWFSERLGGFVGKQVLELGPLEGGHTFMMTQGGAKVTAIESNLRAWMRCLAAKETVGMSGATFMLGDFVKYLQASPPQVDFALASGVLYHMVDPVGLLLSLTKISSSIGLWTHYFDRDVLFGRDDLKGKFAFSPRIQTTPRGRQVELYDQAYLGALDWRGFCGGSAPGSLWMSRQDILGILEDEGFTTEIGFDHRDHQNGPAFCVFAHRRR